jgi:hypothetical protein
MLAVFKSLTKLWVILILLFIGITYPISLLYKNEQPPPPDYKVEGIEVAPNTIFCVSATAMIDGGCSGKTRADCEMLIRKYEAGCYPEDSQQTEKVMQRMREWNENSNDEH